MDYNMKLCNVPQDLLAKQAIIDCVPSMVWLGIITTLIVAAYYLVYYFNKKNLIDGKELVQFGLVLLVLTVVGLGVDAIVLKNILTAIFNPEYAAMVKFATECAK